MIPGGPAQSDANFASGRSLSLACGVSCEGQARVFNRKWYGFFFSLQLLLTFSSVIPSWLLVHFEALRGSAADLGPNLSVSQNVTLRGSQTCCQRRKRNARQVAEKIHNFKNHMFSDCFQRGI